MATKDRCSSSSPDKYQSDSSRSSSNYNHTNLNLNQNSEYFDATFAPVENVSTEKQRKFNGLPKKTDYQKYDKPEPKFEKSNLRTWNDEIILNSSSNYYQSKEENRSSYSKTSSSTLSLHIAAYENSIEASNSNEKSSDISDSKKSMKKEHSVESTSKNIQDPFEIPRQQKDEKIPPETMHFKASQKLFDPNELSMMLAERQSRKRREWYQEPGQSNSAYEIPTKRPYAGLPTLCEVVEIPDNVVGLVIGRGGEQISTIQQESGCHIQMAHQGTPQHTRLCTLNGTRENIDLAKNMITDVISRNATYNLKYTVDQQQQMGGGISTSQAPTQQGGGIPPGCIQRILSIPGTKCGLIIGRNGETIKSLQETLGVKMLLIQENQAISHGPKPLRITGTPDKVENACRTIESIINSEEGGARPQYAKSVGEVIVPRSSVGIIIGKSGETIKRLINESGCKIQFKPDEDPTTPDRCATLQGTPDQIARATQMISDLLQRSQNSGVTETFLMHVPANKTGLVIGKGGDTIKQICGESGAHVELSRDPPPNASEKIFVIKGSPYQIHHAQHIIRIKVGDIPPGTPVPHFTGSNSAAATTTLPTANPYGSTGFDGGYNQWQQNGAYTTGQTDANQWSNYYQQQQPQATAYGGAVYGTGATATSVTSAQTQQQTSGAAPVQDYSAQWAEYYRQMGMHEKAALVEEQAKKQQSSSGTSQQATSGYSTGSYN